MNDNYSLMGKGFRGLMLEANIAANGRWGCLGMAAIALVNGEGKLAFLFVLALFAAYIVEQLPDGLPSRAGRLGLVLFTGLVVVALFLAIFL